MNTEGTKSRHSGISEEKEKDRKKNDEQTNSVGVVVARSFGYPRAVQSGLFTKGQ